MQVLDLPSPRVGVGRGGLGLFSVFLAIGAGFASFASRVPAVKTHLGLSSGSLGLALLGTAGGMVVAAPLTGWALRRVDPRAVIGAGLAVFCVGLQCVDAAVGPSSLFAALALAGLGGGLCDVAMNAEAAALQVRAARPIMSRFHAGWSVGGLVGSGAGALAARAGMSTSAHFAAAGVAVVGIGAAALWALGDAAAPGRVEAPPAEGAAGSGRRAATLVLAVLGAMAAGDFLAEGAAGDWSAVYLHSSLGTDTATAALAFTAFNLAMTCGRLVGDHLTAWLGPVRLVRLAAGLAGGGLGLGLLAGGTVTGIVGFGLLGAGLSVVVPIVFSAAATVGRPSTSMAVATGSGYVGLVAGPAAVGGLAQALGLPAALAAVAGIAALPVLLGGAVRGSHP